MGDSDTIMAQASDALAASVAGGSISPIMENIASSVSAPDAPSVNTTVQGTPDATAYDTTGNYANLTNSSLDSTQVAGYDSSVNVNNVNGAGDGAAAGITENGVAPADGIGSAATHQPLDGSGLSAEEERLWSIVTTNSLDFDAWTALIEETEKTPEANILKFRKVYDTFLAEFPLCYGYWKKYADHEARLSSVDKVAEVYERAVQGVTYSVDMWLHYCVFAIGTYGDPETIRGHLQQRLLKRNAH